MSDFAVTIIGGGVVGLAIAAHLSQSMQNILLLEKNERYGMETSSRNSEVIHAGIYYTPGSLKARLCVEGRDELYSLCAAHNIPHKRITKIITAAAESELPSLQKIFDTGRRNGVELEMLSASDALKMEPNIRSVGAIYSPTTGILSVHGLMDYYYRTATRNSATVQSRCKVVGIEPANMGYKLIISDGARREEISTERVINAAGLECDTIASLAGIDIDVAGYRLTYCKGSYFACSGPKAKIVSRLIYPISTPDSLGIHALFDLAGRMRFGPDMEYLNERKIDYSIAESKRAAFAQSVRRIVPAIEDSDLTPDISGIRPKVQKKGEPLHDFIIREESDKGLPGFINLIGMESPALTSSPAIARYVETLLPA